MSVNAHAALLSQFAKAGSFFNRLHGDTATAELFGVERFISCVARLSRHARQGIVTIYTATCEKARGIYRAISAFLSRISAASQLSVEELSQRIIAHAFRKYGTIRRLFPPTSAARWLCRSPEPAIQRHHSHFSPPTLADGQMHH